MDKINWFDNQHNWIGWFITEALDHTKIPKGGLDGNNLDVKLTVDGIEFDFVSVVEHMGKEFDSSVLKKARELHEEKLKQDFFENLNEVSYLADRLKDEMDTKLQEIYNNY